MRDIEIKNLQLELRHEKMMRKIAEDALEFERRIKNLERRIDEELKRLETNNITQ